MLRAILQEFTELRQLCDPREKSALLFSGTPFAAKQVSSALQNTPKTTEQTVLTQAYRGKTGTEHRTKIEATGKEAVGCKARAELGSAGSSDKLCLSQGPEGQLHLML